MSNSNCLVVIPTRGRANLIRDRILNNQKLSKNSIFCISIDSDDKGDYSWADRSGIIVVSGPPQGMNVALNRAVEQLGENFNFIGFMGDDHQVQTYGWDEKLIFHIEKRGFGVAFGDDLLTNGELPTFAIVSQNIVQALGYLAPPSLRHMFLDDFWLRLGLELNASFYDPRVIVEHLHHSVGKSEFDQTYKATNKHHINLRDKFAYKIYTLRFLRRDIQKIKKHLKS